MLVTPTYAIPPWLARRHPELMAQRADGSPKPFGARQNMDITNSTYRFYAERITRKLLGQYADHPTVVGFQLDNETGTGMLHNPAVFDAFVARLRGKYQTVGAVNEAWGLTYWSHRLGDWHDLWRPQATPTPGTTWNGAGSSPRSPPSSSPGRWASSASTPGATSSSPRRVGTHGRGDADRYQIAALTDVHAENFPHATQDALAHPPVESTIYPATTQGSGPAQLHLRAALAYGANAPTSSSPR